MSVSTEYWRPWKENTGREEIDERSPIRKIPLKGKEILEYIESIVGNIYHFDKKNNLPKLITALVISDETGLSYIVRGFCLRKMKKELRNKYQKY